MLVLFLVSFCVNSYANAELLGAYILPHGGIALDPNHFKTNSKKAMEEAWALHLAGQTVGEEVRRLNPDLIVLSTPHGIADWKNFMFYLNQEASGTGDTDNCACPPCCYNISVKLDFNISMLMMVSLQAWGGNVSGLSAYGPMANAAEPFPLRWGEVIPLHFISPPLTTRVVILSVPTRRYTEDVSMIPEMLNLGGGVWSVLEDMAEKVVLVVSGDLCHRFDPDGPFGYSNASGPFDKACGKWVSEQDPHLLLKVAAGLVDKCYSCGFTGFVMLEGVMEAARQSNIKWDTELLANYHPSYYGMMVAKFLPIRATNSSRQGEL